LSSYPPYEFYLKVGVVVEAVMETTAVVEEEVEVVGKLPPEVNLGTSPPLFILFSSLLCYTFSRSTGRYIFFSLEMGLLNTLA
jgi:hypothetical protein